MPTDVIPYEQLVQMGATAQHFRNVAEVALDIEHFLHQEVERLAQVPQDDFSDEWWEQWVRDCSRRLEADNA